MTVNLKPYRLSLGIEAKEAAASVGIPLRTYHRYEQDDDYGSALKRSAMLAALKERYEITEDKGILTFESIQRIVTEVFDHQDEKPEFCYLFGSYAKGKANDSSDVDLCISTALSGLAFLGLLEDLRGALHKKVDLIRVGELKDNIPLLKEIMKDGIRIYG
ncbi:MAG: nucleotidyltransferase domain-containing protein [Bacilli bacterium]|nr:nucleotidyltransferase domain-containing protein [Bacilli bacterium]